MVKYTIVVSAIFGGFLFLGAGVADYLNLPETAHLAKQALGVLTGISSCTIVLFWIGEVGD